MPVDADKLQIVNYPAESLRAKTKPVPEITDEIRAVAGRMIELMYEAEGIGLAAPQVGLDWRMFVVDVPPSEDGERSVDSDPASATDGAAVYINPSLSGFSRDLVPYEEGCLSLPQITGDVRRPSTCTIKATDLDGREFTQVGEGLLARCWQHEFDHLEGILIIDKFDLATRRSVKAALETLASAQRIVR